MTPADAERSGARAGWALGWPALALVPLATVVAILAAPRLACADGVADLAAVAFAVAPVLAALPLAARGAPGTRGLAALLLGGAVGLACIGALGLTRWLVPLQTGCLVAIGYAVGSFIGGRVQFPGHMLPAAAVAAAADVASVLSPEGPSQAALSSDTAMSVLALAGPIPGTHAFTFVLGVGDLVFIALVLRVAVVHVVPLSRVVSGAAAGLALAFAASALFALAIPALVPIGLGVVAFTPDFRRIRKRERAVTLFACAAAVAVILGVVARAWLDASPKA